MRKVLRIYTLLLTGLFALYIIGCGADDAEEPEEVGVNFVDVDPPSGSLVGPNAVITATFDNVPVNVTASVGVATIEGKKVIIAGPFPQGTFILTITWADGTQPLIYTVPDTEPPKIIGGTIKDKDTGVTTLALNLRAEIAVVFDEEVTGHVTLQTENGKDVGWLGRVEGTIAKVELVRGKEIIDCETTFIIVGKVSDAAGNSADFKVTFTTAGWPEDWTCVDGILEPEDDP